MLKNGKLIPIIDLFAGPGGLSEGFSRHAEFLRDNLAYKTVLSIEKDDAAVQTLRLRAFFRQFEAGSAPEEYYSYIKQDAGEEKARLLKALHTHPEWRRAASEVWKYTLGDKRDDAFKKLHRRIRRRIAGADLWVLLGGPPCQAYSVVGRARRLGNGRDLSLDLSPDELKRRRLLKAHNFFRDERHTLYTEYLETVAIHQPPFFVMENVKGILNSRLPGQEAAEGARPTYIFDRIMKDMADPWLAIKDERLPSGWQKYADGGRRGYNLYSFVEPPNILLGDNAPEDYLIRAELHGVPQDRHRVILLGVREDVDAIPRQLVARTKKVTVQQVIGSLPPLRSGRSGRSEDGKRRDRHMDSPERWADAVRAAVPERLIDQIEPSALRNKLRTARIGISQSLSRGAAYIPWEDASVADPELDRWLTDRRLGGVIQHRSRDHMDSDFGRYLFVAAYAAQFGESPKLRHFPAELLPRHRSAFEVGSETIQSRVFADRFRVQVAGRPATTIMSHIRRDGHYYIHYDPTQCRSLTVREAARLQTFPDNFYFEGNRTDQYEQVGNAVPPFLALQLAAVIADVLKQASISTIHERCKPTQAATLRRIAV